MRSVSGSVLLGLCAVAFLAGRFITQTTQLPAVDTAQLQVASARGLSAESGDSTDTAVDVDSTVNPGATDVAVLPPADPLITEQLENYMLQASGLLKVRPPMTPAFSGDNFVHAIPFQILSWFPRIVVYPAFVDAVRCQHIIKLATQYIYPSGLAFRPGEAVDQNQQTRTSKGTFMSAETDKEGALGWVEDRLAAITMVPREHGEPFNILQYQHMQHYDSHMDSFDPKDFGPQPSQRIATVLVYLSDVEEGGETVFKKEGVAGDQRVITDWRNCNDGSFKYKPRQGDAVLFWGVDLNQEINPRSLHGGCPIIKGEKWVMTKWLRSQGGWPRWAPAEEEAEKKAEAAKAQASRAAHAAGR